MAVEEKKLGFGLVGAGAIAQRIAEALGRSSIATLVGTVGKDQSESIAFSEKYGGIPFDSLDALLADSRTQAVYIATPNYLHREQTVKAAKAGKHVLCEKPLALTVEDAEKMVEACEKEGVLLMVGTNMRFQAGVQQLKDILARGLIGKLQVAEMHLLFPPVAKHLATAWRKLKSQAGGGMLFDTGLHGVDLLMHVVDRPVKAVSAYVIPHESDPEMDRAAFVTLHFKKDIIGLVETSGTTESGRRGLHLYGTTGSASCYLRWKPEIMGALPGNDIEIFQNGTRRLQKTASDDDSYQKEVEHFVSCIRSGEQPASTGTEAVRVLRVIEAAYRSAKTGSVVPISI